MGLKSFGLRFIKSLRPAHYKYKEELNLGNKVHFGVMAQDIDNYLKENSDLEFNIIQYDKDGNMMVNYVELIAPMISSIQELSEEIENLKNQIREQKEQKEKNNE